MKKIPVVLVAAFTLCDGPLVAAAGSGAGDAALPVTGTGEPLELR